MHLTSCVTVTAIKNGSLRDSLLDRERQSSCESLGPGVNPLNYDDTFVNFPSGGLGVGVGIDHYCLELFLRLKSARSLRFFPFFKKFLKPYKVL